MSYNGQFHKKVNLSKSYQKNMKVQYEMYKTATQYDNVINIMRKPDSLLKSPISLQRCSPKSVFTL